MLRKIPRSLVGTHGRLKDACVVVVPRRFMSSGYEAYHDSLSQSHDSPPSLLKTSQAQPLPADEQRLKTQSTEQDNEDASNAPLTEFSILGVRKSVRVALHEAFPSIRTPTPCQQVFIPAVLSRKDVILKDRTGTGKSFALVLALLSKARATRPRLQYKERVALAKRPITSLVIVPHRDLAYQLMHWVRMLCPHNLQQSLDSIAQVCVRGATASPLEQQITKLRQQAPHILIGTPQALVDILESNRGVLQIDTLETVVVDEVDYLLPVPAPSDTKKKFWNWNAHPPPTLRLLNSLFKDRSKVGRHESSRPWRWPLQVVFATATLPSHLRRYLYNETNWMDEYSEVIKINFARDGEQIGSEAVRHYALVVDKTGDVRNFKFKKHENTEDLKNQPSSARSTASKVENAVSAPLLEAVATTFALDVPKIALLVLPASASVTTALKELQTLGVNARSLALSDDDRGKSELMRSTLRKFNLGPRTQVEEVKEEPTLLVSTEASIRGLDLPELTHVFIVGVPESETEYNHAAGRVGRFGRSGKVIVFSEGMSEFSVVREARWTKGEKVDEEERLRRIYTAQGISPSTFEI